MAIREYRGSFLARVGLLERFGEVPKCLPEYYNGFESNTCLEERNYQVYYHYWRDINVKEIENSIKKLFDPKKSFKSELTREYGYDKGIKIEIQDKDPEDDYDSNEIHMSIDIIEFNSTFLEDILAIFDRFDCLCIIEDTGKIIDTKYELFMEILKNSRRYKQVTREGII